MILPEIVREITEKYDLPYGMVNKIVRHIFNDMKEALSKGNRVEIRDFGIFSLRKRDERVTRNPKTGENLVTPRKQVVHFKVGKELRERVKQKGI